jgi:tetratricopeptide (TPR) repeat protein
VATDNTHLFDEARLRLAKALADHSRLQDSQEVLTDFLKVRLASNRSPEACKALLQTSTTNPTNAEALETLWSLIGHENSFCQNPSAHEVIMILQKAYMLAGTAEEFERRRCEKTKALLGPSSNTLTPCHCSMALLWGSWRISRSGDHTLSAAHLEKLETATQHTPSIVVPQILADVATQLDKNGQSQKALAVWRSLLKWNPQTRLKDLALLRLGSAAAANDEPQRAISFFERFEVECGKSALMPEMLLSRARIHFKNHDELHQTADLNRIVAAKSAPLKVRAEALLELGELKLRKEEYANAIIYLQRAYVTCIGSHEHAARAYERCAFAFEKINQADAAAQLYSELMNHPDLADTTAAKECRSRQHFTPAPPPSPQNETD